MSIDRRFTASLRDPGPALADTGPLAVLPAFADGMAALPGELGGLGKRLQSAARGEDWRSYQRLLQQFVSVCQNKYLVSAPHCLRSYVGEYNRLAGSRRQYEEGLPVPLLPFVPYGGDRFLLIRS